MRNVMLLIMLLAYTSVYGQSNGLWNICSTSSQCSGDTPLCEDGACVGKTYNLKTAIPRLVPLSSGGFFGFVKQVDDNDLTRSSNSTAVTLSGSDVSGYEGQAWVLSSFEDIIAYDISVLVDVSGSQINQTNLEQLQDQIDTLAHAVFSEESDSRFLSVFAFAGMEDTIELKRYATKKSTVSSIFSHFDTKHINDQSTNLFGAVKSRLNQIRRGADHLPNNLKSANYIAHIVIILTDGRDTSARTTQSDAVAVTDAIAAAGGAVFAVPLSESNSLTDVDTSVLSDLSSVSFNYSNLITQSATLTVAYEIASREIRNYVGTFHCPESRGDDVTVTFDGVDDSVSFPSEPVQSFPQCGNVFNGKVPKQDYSLADNIEPRCIDSFGHYMLCGLNSGFYCGECSGRSMTKTMVESETFAADGSTIFKLSSDGRSSMKINFKNTGEKERGYRAYAQLGSVPNPIGNAYTYYAPSAKRVKTVDDACASCKTYTYTWEVPCSKSFDLNIETIHDEDIWFIRLDSCVVYKPQPDDGIPDDTSTPSNILAFAETDYLVKVTIDNGPLSGGAIAGITISCLVVGFIILYFAAKFCATGCLIKYNYIREKFLPKSGNTDDNEKMDKKQHDQVNLDDGTL